MVRATFAWPLLLIAAAMVQSPAAAQSERFEIGFRGLILLGKGKRANDMSGAGVVGRFKLDGGSSGWPSTTRNLTTKRRIARSGSLPPPSSTASTSGAGLVCSQSGYTTPPEHGIGTGSPESAVRPSTTSPMSGGSAQAVARWISRPRPTTNSMFLRVPGCTASSGVGGCSTLH